MTRCSLCNTKEKDVKFMIRTHNPRVAICNVCAQAIKHVSMQVEKDLKLQECERECDFLIDESTLEELEDDLLQNNYYDYAKDDNYIKTPIEIVRELDRTVIGQEEAKKALAVAAYNHLQRMKDNSGLLKKNNVLLIGPSGSGKTMLVHELSKILDVPFVIADATLITQTGYMGEDVNNILVKLVNNAGGDIEKAEYGIVFLDEIDKIAKRLSHNGMKDATGEGVQQELLKIVEGSDVLLMPNKGHAQLPFMDATINTENILFIAAGAFVDMEPVEEKNIGFVKQTKKHTSAKTDVETLVNYGMITELIGRFPVRCELNQLTIEDMVAIMTNPNGSIVEEYKYLFNLYGMDVEFTNQAIEEIAEFIMKSGTGARELRCIFERLTRSLLLDTSINHINISSDYIKNIMC